MFSGSYASFLRQLRALQNVSHRSEDDVAGDAEYDARMDLDVRFHNNPIWNELSHCPPLASIFSINAVNPIVSSSERLPKNSSVARDLRELLTGTYDIYLQALQDRINSDLKFVDYQTATKTFSELPAVAENFRSDSKFSDNYPIQTFKNVCLQFAPKQFSSLIFVGPKSDPVINELLESFSKENRKKYSKNWIPFRYQNDQYSLRRVDKVSPEWHYVDETSFHQLTWDRNPGHQFHWQVWPIFMALNFHRELNLPMVERLIIREGCAKKDAKDEDAEYLNVRTDQWQSINRFWARIALDERYERASETKSEFSQVKLLHSSKHDDCLMKGEKDDGPHTLCFKQLLLSDTHDQYFDQSPQSVYGLRAFRKAAYRFLDLDHIPFPAMVATKPARPLRVLIYSRMDSSRRRILNVKEIFAALPEPRFQVRHLVEFGGRPPHEQLSAYAHADILIAPHGAHMTWSLMLPEDAIVVECFADPLTTFSWIENMVKAVGVRRIEHIGIPAEKPLDAPPSFRDMDRDFRVDVDMLCKQLKLKGVYGCGNPADIGGGIDFES